MIKKCPHCEFEPIQDQLICPNCGSELNENISKKIKEDPTPFPLSEGSNDDINWSNYQDVPLGAVMEHFNDAIEEPELQKAEGVSSTDELSDNPILEAYLRRHREGSEDADEALVAAIEQQKQKETASVLPTEEELIVVKEKTAMTPTIEEESADSVAFEPKIDSPSETVEEAIVVETLDPSPVAPQEVVVPEEDAISEAEKVISLIHRFETEEAKKTGETVQATSAKELTEEKKRPKVDNNKRVKGRSKKKLYLLSAAGILFIAGGGWLYVDAQQKAEAAKQEQLQQAQDFAAVEAELQAFYLDSEQQFVKPEKTLAEVRTLIDQLSSFKQQENYSETQTFSQTLYKKMLLMDEVNQYFTAPILVGDTLDRTVHIKDTQPIEMALLAETDAFSKQVNEALQLGKIELQQVQSAKDAVAEVMSFYQDGKLAADLSRPTFEAAKKQVTDLFELPEKKTLTAELESVEGALVSREKAEEARMAAEKQAAAEEANRIAAEQAANAAQEILSAQTPTNANNAPIISSRQSDINDVNNAGWSWAPGVYDKFMNTVISRGYVVANGFYLEPARIENGEGYYHLYATSNQSSLLKGTPQSSLPFYLVTVNVKTGYFKGNGAN